MAVHSIGVVLVRLFSIYLAINAFQTLFYLLPNMFSPEIDIFEWRSSAAFWFLSLAILLPAASAYWLWSNVEVVVPQVNNSDDPGIDLANAMLLGISLMGLWLFVWGIISLVRTESSLAVTQNIQVGEKWAQRAPYLAQILVSLPFIFAKKRILAILQWARFSGRRKG